MAKSFISIKRKYGFNDTMPLGQYVGTPMIDMLAQHREYLEWCLKNKVMEFTSDFKETLLLIWPKPDPILANLKKVFPENFRPKGYYDMDYDALGFDDVPF